MAWLPEDLVSRPFLDDFAKIENGDAVADMLDNAETVGNQHVGQVVLRLQAHEEIENLRLNGDVESGCRFIKHQQPRVEGQGRVPARPAGPGHR